ncbi:hypothetical protein ALC60_10111 [Trachymyrmex zeteki]|uniref:Uncharacterized protein n=1 Tax=Mycetomoellerius zeteki TaxID=64791 RepID=A0A151WSL4_9HYME|nr:hypothetical protein ALC60_10111 [Trachymyrmex zeteki]
MNSFVKKILARQPHANRHFNIEAIRVIRSDATSCFEHEDTVVSAEAKSQPLRRNRKNVVVAAAASCQGGAPVTHASQARRRARTLASPLCPGQTLARLYDLQDTLRAEPGRQL